MQRSAELRNLRLLAVCLAAVATAQSCHDIEGYGAIAGIDSHAQALVNGQAFAEAVAAANASASGARCVLVGQRVYAFLPAVSNFAGVSFVTVYLEGTLNVSTANFSTSFPGWPDPWAVLSFSHSVSLSFVSTTGRGLVNGRGNAWWWYTILVADHRNNLLTTNACVNTTVQGITFLNSPQYHLGLWDSVGLTVQGVTVLVDIEDQLNVFRYLGGSPPEASVSDVLRRAAQIGPVTPAQLLEEETVLHEGRHAAHGPLAEARRSLLPAQLRQEAWWDSAWTITPPVPMIWALNTDGIDFTGSGTTVRNCSVTNFDDSVCVKPIFASASAFGTPCTSGTRISDVRITYGVGVSMGSVPPDVGNNCIDDVIAKGLDFTSPLKAVYVKPNPAKFGTTATGQITNVLYEDVIVRDPLWWSIWAGPQQQQQPGSAGTGCSFLFPLGNTSCPTDPTVTVANLTLRNMTVINSLLSPGILLMNVSNPAVGFVFDGVVFVNASTWPVAGGAYLCENVAGIARGGTTPVPPCFTVAD
jgi:hypothetical protein